MPWNHMQVKISPEDQLVEVIVGSGEMSREQALQAVQEILDRAREINPALTAAAAETWRRGAERGSVHAELFEWRIYEHPEGQDPRRAASALFENSPWVSDWDSGGEDFLLQVDQAIGTDTQLAQLAASDAPAGEDRSR